MTYDPNEIRAAIDDAVSASNELQSLMNYISLDELVGLLMKATLIILMTTIWEHQLKTGMINIVSIKN